MINDDPGEAFLISELAALAKAIFSNLELIVLLEVKAERPRTDEHLKSLWGNRETRENIKNTYVTGRFLHFRRLHPTLTDEALENRIAWILRSAGHEPSARDRRLFDDPAHCLLKLLTRLAEVFLCEARDGSIRVRSQLQTQWHDLVLVVPPLLVTAAWMAARRSIPDETTISRAARIEFQRRVQLWLCDSTLPVDDDPLLDQLCATEGLDETHMHLNGTTEAEKVWMDVLARPREVLKALRHRATREGGLHTRIGDGIDRLLRQEDPNLTPTRLHQRIEQAITAKAFLLEALDSHYPLTNPSGAFLLLDPQARYGQVVRARPLETDLTATTTEALHLVDIISYLASGNGTEVHGLAFFYYALIRAQFCRLLVQQADQIGFDQFQYITLNELREATEKDYAERFRQIERGFQKSVNFLEGRFAPKENPERNASLLMQILRGYIQFLDERAAGIPRGNLNKLFSDPKMARISLAEALRISRELEEGSHRLPRSERRLRLGLVAHFIKRTDTDERNRFLRDEFSPICRDSKARRMADRAAQALVALLQSVHGLSSVLRGVDAASNERHAGPEVFAPVFRRMRRAQIQRFTYHVGEDFVHLASGLRAINEAVLFLDLTSGCRLGHATAAGLSPEKWWQSVGDAVIQPSEDRLDDLVFVWGTLKRKHVFQDRIALLDAEIRHLAMYIWEDPYLTPDILLRAWQLRYIDPIIRSYGNYDVNSDRNAEIKIYKESQARDPKAHAQFLLRHGAGLTVEARIRCRQPILVKREGDILDHELLEFLQTATLELIQKRNIAIETLPSSNVRISIHQSYNEHHAAGWLGYGKALCPTSVVIGTDDPGIFATSLRAEYAHMLHALEANGAGANAAHTLQTLAATSRRFRF